MTTIIEDYCSLEIAKLLKEKGFDSECSKFYMPDDFELHFRRAMED